MPPKRMTANPQKPARYRPGKPITDEVPSSSDESESDAEEASVPTKAPPPKASSFPATSNSAKIASTLKQVDLNAVRRQAAKAEDERLAAEKAARAKQEEEAGFVTASSSEASDDDDDEGDGSGTSSAEESSSEEEAAPRLLLRPTFIKKSQRKNDPSTSAPKPVTEEETEAAAADEQARRLAAADALVLDQLAKNAAARAAGRKAWDDESDGASASDGVDDTDGLDPAGEHAAWRLRELQRVKRARDTLIAAEQEREEVERRRQLTQAEREAEDGEFLARQREQKDARGSMAYLQKYFHKGAFFRAGEDVGGEGLANRELMGARFQDQVDRELLPKYMQVRDLARLGRKGATKYRDLKTEDTGRWGQFGGTEGRGRGRDTMDRDGGGAGSGANATVVRERRGRAPEGAPEGPRGDRNGKDGGDTYRPGPTERGSDGEEGESRRRRSPPRRRASYSRSRSRSRRRDWRDDDRDRRKRSPSPYYHRDRHGGDKRRRVNVS